MAIPSQQIGWGTEEKLLWQISKQLEYLTRVTYNLSVAPLPSNCIEFVVNTTYDTYFDFTAQSFSQDFTYTITWGDGTTDTGSSGEGTAFLSHTYATPNREYTARICFSNAAIINQIDFPGFD